MKKSLFAVYVFLFMTASRAVMAFDNTGFSAESSFGYDLYDIAFNKVLGGPIGWVAVAVLVIVGFYNLGKGQFQPAVLRDCSLYIDGLYYVHPIPFYIKK